MVNSPGKRFMARYQRARGRRDMYATVIDEAYEFALPLRQRISMRGRMPGPAEIDRLFDATACDAVQALASQMLDDVWPADQTPFELKAGPGLDPDKAEAANRQLAGIASLLIDMINNSNFRSAAHEMFLDYTIAEGILLIEQGRPEAPLLFRSVPLSEAVLDKGPYDKADALFRPQRVQASHIQVLWPSARMPEALANIVREMPDSEIDLVSGIERDWTVLATEVWVHRVVWCDEVIFEDRTEGVGSCPFVTVAFSRTSGEVMGRGPIQIALADVKSLNATVERVFETADLALSGVWLYDDNGVINPDTAVLEPGSLLPRMPGSKGLENVGPSADIRWAQMMLDRLPAQIKNTLYVNDLGDLSRTPRSATEVAQRTADRARRLSGAYGRLLMEFLFPLVSRVWWLVRRQNGAMGLPAIDGEKIKVRPLSPLTRAQATDDVLRHTNYLGTLAAYYGPQAPLVMTDAIGGAQYLADKMGFNPALLNERAKIEALMAQAAQMAQGAQPAA
jgi:hypothetical protein